MSLADRARIFAVAWWYVVLIGATVAAIYLLLDGFDGAPSDLGMISLGASGQFTIVGGLIGGVAAVRAANSADRPSALRGWVRKGIVWGCVLGLADVVLCAGLISIGATRTQEDLLFAATVAPFGVVAGGISGALVGGYCHKLLG